MDSHSRRLAERQNWCESARSLITDVDNTLLDWQDLWYQTFSAMIAKVIEISGVDQERSTRSAALSIKSMGRANIPDCWGNCPVSKSCMAITSLKMMAPAIDAFRDARRRVLATLPHSQ